MCDTQALTFCSQCTPSSEITAYVEGKSHITPVFGDGDQFLTANRIRRSHFKKLLRALDPSICDWPEYRKRFGYSGHVQRMIRFGRRVFLDRNTMPSTLRTALDQARQRIAELNGVRSGNDRHARREYKRVYCRWVKENLAEVEMVLTGRVVYGSVRAPQKTGSTIFLQNTMHSKKGSQRKAA